MTQSQNNWVKRVVEEKESSDKLDRLKLQKEAVGNTRQDMSRPVLESLLNEGYTIVVWDSGISTHAPCVELNNQQWTLEDFVSNLEHDAPIFERTHPGDNSCSVVVQGDNLPPVRVDSFGDVTEV